MTLLLNAAIEPGFVAVQRDGAWEWRALPLGRGGPFPGVLAEALGVDVRAPSTIVVVHGPGSSTGLRTICSYANALALMSGATLAVCSSFDVVRALHPAHPTALAFPQPLGRIVVATCMDGEWRTDEPDTFPSSAWRHDAKALTVDPMAFSAIVASAHPTELAIPRYWAAPQITKTAKR